MTTTARHILNVICLRESLPVDGWEHYSTTMSDDGIDIFGYDREDGSCLIVYSTSEGYVIDPRSILSPCRQARKLERS